MTGTLAGKTLFITGGSRGIGKAIALRAARDGARIVIAAKTDQPHPKLPGTIHTAAQEIAAAGGKALAVACDIRFEDQVVRAVERAVAAFGGIDILVNNASAISLTGTLATPVKRFDLMMAINARGTWLCSRSACPISRGRKTRISWRFRHRSICVPNGLGRTLPIRCRNTPCRCAFSGSQKSFAPTVSLSTLSGPGPSSPRRLSISSPALIAPGAADQRS